MADNEKEDSKQSVDDDMDEDMEDMKVETDPYGEEESCDHEAAEKDEDAEAKKDEDEDEEEEDEEDEEEDEDEEEAASDGTEITEEDLGFDPNSTAMMIAADLDGLPPQSPFVLLVQGKGEKLAAVLRERPQWLRAKDKLGRTLLHLSLMRCMPDMLSVLLATPDKAAVAAAVGRPFRGIGRGRQGRKGFPALHLCLSRGCSARHCDQILKCLEMLSDLPEVKVDAVDASGRTALHLACLHGNAQIVSCLLKHHSNAALGDIRGLLPLHYAVDSFGSTEAFRKVLAATTVPELAAEESHPLYRCIDRQAWEAAEMLLADTRWRPSEASLRKLDEFATRRGVGAVWKMVCDKAGCSATADVQSASGRSSSSSSIPATVTTLLATHQVCRQHGPLPQEESDHLERRVGVMSTTPENPHRLEVLCGETGVLSSECFKELKWNREPDPVPLADVLRVHEFWYIHRLSEAVQDLQKKPTGALRRNGGGQLDSGDTMVTPQSWHAAMRACGAVLAAVDAVCGGEARNAFCAVRPPGHHVGPAGACNKDLADDPEGSQGFCLVNNVAVGAAYARCVHRRTIRKVAIVDFDVHHGNGTEAIVRNVILGAGSGRKAPGMQRIRSQGFTVDLSPPPSSKPWLDPQGDAKEIFFASMHGYGDGFYPGTGAACFEANPSIVNVTLPRHSGSADFRAGLRSEIFPELLHFAPDMIFISAGFDGHSGDPVGNTRCCEDDFVWATQHLLAIANRCCSGRLVSVLEGGYNTVAEAISPFALSVAAHVRTLMHTSPSYTYLENEERVQKGRKRPGALPEIDPETLLPQKKSRMAPSPRGQTNAENVKLEEDPHQAVTPRPRSRRLQHLAPATASQTIAEQ